MTQENDCGDYAELEKRVMARIASTEHMTSWFIRPVLNVIALRALTSRLTKSEHESQMQNIPRTRE